MGTGGTDVAEVFRLTPQGLQSLAITDEGYVPPDYRDEGMGSTPRLEVREGELTRWWIINAKHPRLPKSGWKKVVRYRWQDNQFVVRSTEELRAD